MSARTWDVVVVGAGHNGLVAAAYLARAGLDVLVLDRQQVPGGAATTEELFGGYRTSPCAYWLHVLQSKVVKDLELRRFGFSVLHTDPVYCSPYEDGRTLIQWHDVKRTQNQIAAFSGHDAARFPEFVDFWRRAGAMLDPYTLSESPPTVAQLQERAADGDDAEVLDRLLNQPIRPFLDSFFEDERVQAAFMPNSDIKSLDAPGELLGWAMTGPNRGARPEDQGVPVGGMGTFTGALARAAEHAGVHIRLGVEVAQVCIDDAGVVRGVELGDGTLVDARAVISNADPKRTFSALVPAGAVSPELRATVDALDTDSGSLKFHAAVSELPDLSGHLGSDHDPRLLHMLRIAPSTSYIEKSLTDAAAGRATDHPIHIVQIPTVYDPSAAPEGRHVVSVRVKFEPSQLATGTWDGLRNGLGEQVIDRLTDVAPNFKRSVLDWVVYTPDDMQTRTGLTDGNIHHVNHSASHALGDRLFPGGGYRTPIRGLFMCGAGTHPGGEVTGASGHNAAAVVLGELRRTAVDS
jgi:phytoene dehydrogenase-like protein